MEHGNSLWYKDTVIYQVHVMSYADSNGDGIGDFRGLTRKLDYIKGLGITALWILPFYPSPMKDGGYDISNYTGINPDYGTIADFKRFLKEAHKRNLRVITELVLNHTSSEHPWFKRARRSPAGSKYRDFYVWNDTPDKYRDARIIFNDFESSNWAWDNQANAYYWHRFYAHQPDLNFDNPEVRRALTRVLDFWFGMGVDGVRLDAIPYLYEREGTNCENLPETHDFLKKLRKTIDQRYQDKMLLAEANQWTEDAVAYFGEGDECHMSFHFPLMPRLFMGLRMEDRFPVMDIFEQTPDIPENCQWAIFLRNHDELTLEMVTDEERDYMYRSYALDPRQRINLGIRRRLAPLLENDRRKIELLNILLLSFPGSPVIYYGDELGMGDNYYLGDRDGVRTPMQWSSDKNAGFSASNPQQLYLPVIIDPEYHYETINVENQEINQSSLLWWMRQVIRIRKKFRCFSRGTMKFIPGENSHVLAFSRELDDEIILVLANLSRYPQLISLDLSSYKDFIPREVFSQEDFPVIREDDYNLSLGSHGYLWFNLVRQPEGREEETKEKKNEIRSNLSKWNRPDKEIIEQLETGILGDYIKSNRWYRGKAKKIRTVQIIDHIPVTNRTQINNHILMVEFSYTNAANMVYFLFLGLAVDDKMYAIRNEHPGSIIAEADISGERGVIFDPLFDGEFRQQLFSMFRGRRKLKGRKGTISFYTGGSFYKKIRTAELPPDNELLMAEQSNTTVLYGDIFLLKFYRALEEGINPEVQILKYLTDKQHFPHAPSHAGSIEYRVGHRESITLGILTDYVPHEINSWNYYLNKLDQYFNNILSGKGELKEPPRISFPPTGISLEKVPEKLAGLTGPFTLEMTGLLGKRTAEMHMALAADSTDEEFSTERFSLLYQKALYQSFRGLTRKSFTMLRSQLGKMPEQDREEAADLLEKEKDILTAIGSIKKSRISSLKSRIHGDYHLGQVLFTGKDFVIIDFEGEPARTLSERQLKYCPFKDIAGMIRSFHYAAYTALNKHTDTRPENREFLEPWVELWYKITENLFLHAYLETLKGTGMVPGNGADLKILIRFYLMEKAIYELGYELNNRPEWVMIPVRGIKYLLEDINQ